MFLKTYYPYPGFPPVSISGDKCRLKCRHCNSIYLKGMTPVSTSEKLIKVCKKLDENNAVGILLSGGYNKDGGLLNLERMLPAIKKIKKETKLIINIHPGLLSKNIADNLLVDFASLEIPSNFVIKNVFRLNKTIDDYVETYYNLKNAGIDVIPHVCVYSGDEHKLLENIEPPSAIVVIVFTPTKNTPMQNESAPEAKMIGKVIRNIKKMFSYSEISLGCMRPRDRCIRTEIEIEALKSGISRMELPSKKTIKYAKEKGYEIKRLGACCALPEKYEYLAEIK
ncbi:MAG: hypothetical protein QMC80_04880 [Thermoplasmatales archaeon]|nr:hypothetical protein [Thermoplasmatales archaeon]